MTSSWTATTIDGPYICQHDFAINGPITAVVTQFDIITYGDSATVTTTTYASVVPGSDRGISGYASCAGIPIVWETTDTEILRLLSKLPKSTTNRVSSATSTAAQAEGVPKRTIKGTAIGFSIFASLLFGGIYLFWRWRRIKLRATRGQPKVPPNTFEMMTRSNTHELITESNVHELPSEHGISQAPDLEDIHVPK